MRLEQKVAIITGAGAGIGRATALLFAREGASIVAVDVNGQSLDELSKSLAAYPGAFMTAVADVSKRDEVEGVIVAAIERFGKIDILFNNAGIVPRGTVDQTSEDEWDRAMDINVKSTYLFSHGVIPIFRKLGGGVILNTASATALRAVPDRACYTASKGAVIALSRSMALDHARENIRVNCLCPGTVDTPSLAQRLSSFPNPDDARANFIARQPMGRFGTAEEVAEAALYLVSAEAAFVTGIAFAIDGGLSL
jgi:meso-butanediol dehydrogenase/(S,S)-butanediol dehydrogenase/diacetyl reductase